MLIFTSEMNKARICELLGCFKGVACSEMCVTLFCAAEFVPLDWLQLLIIAFAGCTWTLSSPLESLKAEKLLWMLPRQTTTAQGCELIFCTLTPSSRHRGHGTLLLCVDRAPCIASREGGRPSARLRLLFCSAQCCLPPCKPRNKPCCLSCLLKCCLSFPSLEL